MSLMAQLREPQIPVLPSPSPAVAATPRPPHIPPPTPPLQLRSGPPQSPRLLLPPPQSPLLGGLALLAPLILLLGGL